MSKLDIGSTVYIPNISASTRPVTETRITGRWLLDVEDGEETYSYTVQGKGQSLYQLPFIATTLEELIKIHPFLRTHLVDKEI